MERNGSSESQPFRPTIKVIGLGGGGGNVIARMGRDASGAVEMIAANTDNQALRATGAPVKVLLGANTTAGRGAGSKPEVGRACAEESEPILREKLRGTDLLFIAAGLGGGTGSGASPVVARLAREQGALAVAVVTLPFAFEGKRRARVAGASLQALARHADIVLVIPNDKLVDLSPRDMTLLKAFAMADDVLRDVIRGISDLVTGVGLVNVDFADLRTVMENKGKGVIGMGSGKGEARMPQAVRGAIANPLMGAANIKGAKGLLVHITGDEHLSLLEINEAMAEVQRQAAPDSNVIFGATTKPGHGEAVTILVIATGIEEPF
jgi:cell division protein FtsZ